jgi:HPt (histidine-containing phosphotransfer) domain-containing protein
MSDKKDILNAETISMLKTLESSPDSTDFLDDLIQTYFRDAPKTIKELGDAITDGDLGRIKHYAHKLKGSSRNLGVEQVGNHAANIEKNALDGQKATVQDFEEVQRAFAVASVELRSWIGRVS